MAVAGPRHAPDDIEVATTEQLLAALQPGNAGRRIRVAPGDYVVERPLQVPDRVTLEGSGVMGLDADGLPAGFEPGTAPTLRVTSGFDGDVLTLGNGSVLRGLRVLDLQTAEDSRRPRRGNVVRITSRVPGDRLAAAIVGCELVSPHDGGFGDTGPRGHGIVVLTQNPALGAPPGAHVGARVALRVERSIVRARASGSALFAINFAAHGSIDLRLQSNRLEGSLAAGAGVSRPDAVTDAVIRLDSRHNLYRRDYGGGWFLLGASTSPHYPEAPDAGPSRNRLVLDSTGDRLEGFDTGIWATAARRLGSSGSPLTDNRVDLRLRGTRLATKGPDSADFVFRGTFSEVTQGEGLGDFAAGHRNVLNVRFDGVHGSGERRNEYADVVGPTQPERRGTGNRLRVQGSVGSLDGVSPMPDRRFYDENRPPAGTVP